MIDNLRLQLSRTRRHALLHPGDEHRLRLALHLADSLADQPAYVMSIAERRLLEREVSSGRFGRLIVQDGYGTVLGSWWPNRDERRKLRARHSEVEHGGIALYNGFGSLVQWIAAS